MSLDTAICGKNYDHLAWRVGEIGVSRYKVMHRLQTPRSSLLDIESRRCGPGTEIVSAIVLLVPALPSAFTPQNTLPSSQEISKDPRGPGSCGVGRIEPLSYGRVHRPRPMPSITIQGNRRPAGSSWDNLHSASRPTSVCKGHGITQLLDCVIHGSAGISRSLVPWCLLISIPQDQHSNHAFEHASRHLVPPVTFSFCSLLLVFHTFARSVFSARLKHIHHQQRCDL